MSHTSWNLLKRIPRLGRVPYRIIWLEGHISALEDVVEGLEHQLEVLAMRNDEFAPHARGALRGALEHVNAILTTAQDTLRGLQAIQKEEPRD
jgi:hypothetical protein